MVDDAHGEGVLGKGRGIVHHFGLAGSFDVEIGTLSKAFGAVGGVIAGKRILIDYMRQKARPSCSPAPLPPPTPPPAWPAVDILESSTELVDRLWANAEYFKAGMKELGFDTGATQTPIVPVMLGEAPLAKQFSRRLFEEGVFAMAIGFPTVAKGKARIRVMNTAAHTSKDLDLGLAAFAKVGVSWASSSTGSSPHRTPRDTKKNIKKTREEPRILFVFFSLCSSLCFLVSCVVGCPFSGYVRA